MQSLETRDWPRSYDLCTICPMSIGQTPSVAGRGRDRDVVRAPPRARRRLPRTARRARAELGERSTSRRHRGRVVAQPPRRPARRRRAARREQLVQAVDALDPVELRRHLLGRYAWSWCTLAGSTTSRRRRRRRVGIRPAARASERTTAATRARRSASSSPLDPVETRDRIADAIAAGLARCSDLPPRRPRAAGERRGRPLEAHGRRTAIERLASGYRYVPEPEAERVVLIPHLEPTLPLVLAQHRSSG